VVHPLEIVARHNGDIGFSVGGVMNKYARDEHAGAATLDDANPENDAILPVRVQQLQRLDRAVDGISVHTDALDVYERAIGTPRRARYRCC
jgi:hypothetical protein